MFKKIKYLANVSRLAAHIGSGDYDEISFFIDILREMTFLPPMSINYSIFFFFFSNKKEKLIDFLGGIRAYRVIGDESAGREAVEDRVTSVANEQMLSERGSAKATGKTDLGE